MYIARSAWRMTASASSSAGTVVSPILTVTRSVSLSVDMSAGELPADASGELDRDARGALEVLAQDDELVAADASDSVARACRFGEPLSCGDEDLIADEVAVPVVDGLERIDVDEQEPDVGAVTLPQLQGVGEPVEEQTPVRQSGQRVVVGEMCQAGLLGRELVAASRVRSVSNCLVICTTLRSEAPRTTATA